MRKSSGAHAVLAEAENQAVPMMCWPKEITIDSMCCVFAVASALGGGSSGSVTYGRRRSAICWVLHSPQ
jgi:hypothetical protein